MLRFASGVILFIISLFFISFTLSCNKDPEVITNTVIIRDTINLVELIPDTATMFVLVRHAEVESSGSDPDLNMAGIERTETLHNTLESLALTAVYSTDFNRTKQTAQPIANDRLLALDLYGMTSLNPLVDEILEDHLGEIILVVGHSDTTPTLLNILTGTTDYSSLEAEEYDNLFVVTVFEKGRSEVVHLRYGE